MELGKMSITNKHKFTKFLDGTKCPIDIIFHNIILFYQICKNNKLPEGNNQLRQNVVVEDQTTFCRLIKINKHQLKNFVVFHSIFSPGFDRKFFTKENILSEFEIMDLDIMTRILTIKFKNGLIKKWNWDKMSQFHFCPSNICFQLKSK